jgi:L-lactate dehydrogenase (cytochrome)/glycolate oxidase
VENVLDILRSGIDSAVLGLGHRDVKDLRPEDVVVPATWPRVLGTEDQKHVV